jgi:hypothetical protein
MVSGGTEENTPMNRTWKTFGLTALLASALLTGPVRADPPTTAERLEDIQKNLDKLSKSMTDLARVLPALEEIKKQVEDVRVDARAGALRSQTEIKDLKDQIAQLKSEVDALRKNQATTNRVAMSPPSENQPAAPTTGHVEITNTYPAEVVVIINRRSYHVLPGQTVVSEPVLAGTFTYEVLGVTEQRTRTLAANKTYPIWVHPQP